MSSARAIYPIVLFAPSCDRRVVVLIVKLLIILWWKKVGKIDEIFGFLDILDFWKYFVFCWDLGVGQHYILWTLVDGKRIGQELEKLAN